MLPQTCRDILTNEYLSPKGKTIARQTTLLRSHKSNVLNHTIRIFLLKYILLNYANNIRKYVL